MNHKEVTPTFLNLLKMLKLPPEEEQAFIKMWDDFDIKHQQAIKELNVYSTTKVEITPPQ